MKKTSTETAPAGRRHRQKVATRARIVEAALDLLSRQEYGATTIEQITEAADVGKGTYFNYFASKEHLLIEVGKQQLAAIRTAVEAALIDCDDSKRVFRDLFFALTELFTGNPVLGRNLILANLGNDSARELMARNIAERERWLSKLVAKGKELGEIRKDLKPAQVARLFLHAYFGNLMYWALQPPAKPGEWLRFSFERFWASIAAETTDAPPDGER